MDVDIDTEAVTNGLESVAHTISSLRSCVMFMQGRIAAVSNDFTTANFSRTDENVRNVSKAFDTMTENLAEAQHYLQRLMGIWARYFSYHRVVLLGSIIASLGLRNISIIPILIFSSVSAILSYALMLNLSRLTLCFKRWVFYIFVAVYGLLSVIAPAVTFIISFIYTFVFMCIFVRNAGAEKDKKVSAVTYVCFMMASTFLLPANFPAWLTIAITVIGFIALMILYRNRGLMNIQRFRFSWWMVLGFSVLAAGMLTHINFNWESFLPNFLGVAPTGDGSEGSLSAPQILLLSSSCVIVLFMIIFTAKGATSFSGIVCPIYSISGAALSLLLMNLLVSVIPGFAEGFANFQVFIVILIGIAFAIPCAIFQVIIWAIARNLRSDY